MKNTSKSKYIVLYKKFARKGCKQEQLSQASLSLTLWKSGKRESNHGVSFAVTFKRICSHSVCFLLAASSSVNANYRVKGLTYKVQEAGEEIQPLMATKDVASIIQCQDMYVVTHQVKFVCMGGLRHQMELLQIYFHRK